ncbi:MAG: hypothetical protein JEY94_09580 [Melioribacteraceae bacterium]|nr:hypothetical protein [Melioribacteraceae bacterium]
MQKIFTLILLILFVNSCGEKKNLSSTIVIGTSKDIESLNPLYDYCYLEGNITSLLYSSLVQHKWDSKSNKIITYPMLAESWQWNNERTELEIILRNDIYWSDSTKITVDDFIFSYELYSSPDVQSRYFGMFNNYFLNSDKKIDIDKSFSKFSGQKLIVKFRENSAPTLYDIDLPILPKHNLNKLSVQELKNSTFTDSLITSGPLKLVDWKKTQFMRFKKNPISVLASSDMPDEYIFKIVPNYNNMLIQLTNGEIDFVEELKPVDKESLINEKSLIISSVKGREYDFIGWNNIDPLKLSENNRTEPNPLFGSSEIRKALTQAIDTETILEEYLLNNGEPAFGPIAPIFKNYYNAQLNNINFNPSASKNMLSKLGWKDSNNNGTIDKDGVEFGFTLIYPSGNPRRKFAATMIKKNLSDIGINVEINSLDMNQFGQKIFTYDFEACMLGWLVPLPIDLKPFWHSDKNIAQANFVSFSNGEVDDLLTKNEAKITDLEYKMNIGRIQEILSDEQPVTFLYWIDNIVAHNKRITNVKITPMGALHHIWEWELAE